MSQNNGLQGKWVLVDGLLPRIYGQITMEITEEQITGRAGCNMYFARYESRVIDENNGLFDPQEIASTRMSCGLELDGQEQRYFYALDTVRTYELRDEGNTLLLPYPSPTRYLEFRRM